MIDLLMSDRLMLIKQNEHYLYNEHCDYRNLFTDWNFLYLLGNKSQCPVDEHIIR